MSCTTATCNPYHISLFTYYCDVPNVTLIEGTSIITNAISLAGECTKCKTCYYADHEDYKPVGGNFTQECFINSARYSHSRDNGTVKSVSHFLSLISAISER